MGTLIIIILLFLACIGLWLLTKILKWIFIKKERVISMLLLLASIVVSLTIHQLFFVKMEFIQSKVYADLYLIKHPVKNKDSLYKAIKEKVVQLTNNQFKENEISKEIQLYTLRFYEYSKGDWGENGTVYFLDHKEKPDGMLPELLEYYPEYLLAEFSTQPCINNNANYFGMLAYYHKNKQIKTDTLFISCK